MGNGCLGASHLLTILNLAAHVVRSKRHFSARAGGTKTVPRTRLGPKKSHQGNALKKARRRRSPEKGGGDTVETVAKDEPEDLLE